MENFPWRVDICARIPTLTNYKSIFSRYIRTDHCIPKFEARMGQLEEHHLHVQNEWRKITHTGAPHYWSEGYEDNAIDIQRYIRAKEKEFQTDRRRLYEKYPIADFVVYLFAPDQEQVQENLSKLLNTLEDYEVKIRNLHTEEAWFLIRLDGILIVEDKVEHKKRIWKLKY